MSSYYVVLQEELDDVDSYIQLKSVAKAAERLAVIAKEIGVTAPSAFVAGAEQNEDFADIAENAGWAGADYQGGGADGWFDADEGLDCARALLGYIESAPESVKRPRAISEELRAFEAVLESALQAGIRFRLEIDE